ncbi:hypothetical protein KAJ27_00275 [bacterium]|nr:hypothetical protein [bacterium]
MYRKSKTLSLIKMVSLVAMLSFLSNYSSVLHCFPDKQDVQTSNKIEKK